MCLSMSLRTIKHSRRRNASRSVLLKCGSGRIRTCEPLKGGQLFSRQPPSATRTRFLKCPLRHQIPEDALRFARTQITMRSDDSIVISFWTGKFNATARITQVFVNLNSQKTRRPELRHIHRLHKFLREVEESKTIRTGRQCGRFACIAILADALDDRNLAKKRNTIFLRHPHATVLAEDILLVFRKFGRSEP